MRRLKQRQVRYQLGELAMNIIAGLISDLALWTRRVKSCRNLRLLDWNVAATPLNSLWFLSIQMLQAAVIETSMNKSPDHVCLVPTLTEKVQSVAISSPEILSDDERQMLKGQWNLNVEQLPLQAEYRAESCSWELIRRFVLFSMFLAFIDDLKAAAIQTPLVWACIWISKGTWEQDKLWHLWS